MNDTLRKIAVALLNHTLREWPFCPTHGKAKEVLALQPCATDEGKAVIGLGCADGQHREAAWVRVTPGERERIVMATQSRSPATGDTITFYGTMPSSVNNSIPEFRVAVHEQNCDDPTCRCWR